MNADLVLPVDRLPQPGETLGAASMDTFPGGKVRTLVPALLYSPFYCILLGLSWAYPACMHAL